MSGASIRLRNRLRMTLRCRILHVCSSHPYGGENYLRRHRQHSSRLSKNKIIIHYQWIMDNYCGAEGDRTPDLVVANHALSQLSYSPRRNSELRSQNSELGIRVGVNRGSCAPCVGLTRVELVTSRLSGVRSNHLSYRPFSFWILDCGFWMCVQNRNSRSQNKDSVHSLGTIPPQLRGEVSIHMP